MPLPWLVLGLPLVGRGSIPSAAYFEKQAQYKKLLADITAYKEQLSSDEQYFELMIAMHAVGLACAACDNEVSLSERLEINKFTTSLEIANIPDAVKDKIEDLTENPPSIEQAHELASRLYNYPSQLFENIIEAVINADDIKHDAEMEFKAAWVKLEQLKINSDDNIL